MGETSVQNNKKNTILQVGAEIVGWRAQIFQLDGAAGRERGSE